MNNLLLLVIGMALVTFIPRMLPMVFLKSIKLPTKVKRFLDFVPYAVLTSLIFPGILSAVNNVYTAMIGGIVSILLSLLRLNLILVVLGGIMAVFLTQQIIN